MRLKWLNDRRGAFKRRPFYGLQAVAVAATARVSVYIYLVVVLGWLNVLGVRASRCAVNGDETNADFLLSVFFSFHFLFRNEIFMLCL